MTNPVITNTIGWIDQINTRTPTKPEQAYDRPANTWINEAQQALELAADLIETLALEQETQQQRILTATIIIDGVLPYLARNLQHLDGCDTDEHPYPNVMWMAGGCRACETLAVIRNWMDDPTPPLTETELDNTLPNLTYL